MPQPAGCPRCHIPVASVGEEWTCPEHGRIAPLWRPETSTYESFADHLRASPGFPTLVPWPLPDGWSVTDFAVAGATPDRARATMACVSGPTELDGPVDVIVVTEEAGTGLGARSAGTVHDDPGADISEGKPVVRVRIDNQDVSLWTVSTSSGEQEWDRSVLAGEYAGRWLWLVLRPASAMLLLRDEWILRDVSSLGPHLLEVPFGGPAPPW